MPAMTLNLARGWLALLALGAFTVAMANPALAVGPGGAAPEPLYLFGIPVDFILFALTLLGVALFHNYTLPVALTGVVVIALYKILFTGFKFGSGIGGFVSHMGDEAIILSNLFLLLVGFALLARHFEKSNAPEAMPAILPDGWLGGFALLILIFVLSAFLDNIETAPQFRTVR